MATDKVLVGLIRLPNLAGPDAPLICDYPIRGHFVVDLWFIGLVALMKRNRECLQHKMLQTSCWHERFRCPQVMVAGWCERMDKWIDNNRWKTGRFEQGVRLSR